MHRLISLSGAGKYFALRCFLLLMIAGGWSCKSPRERLLDEIHSGEEKLFLDSAKRLNESVATGVLLNYIKYADTFGSDTLSADFLFKAGDLANGLNRPMEAITYFDRLVKDYPEYKKAAAALFMKAFIYETRMDDSEKAKKAYSEFLEKYPEHPLTPSAKATLEQLNSNLSNEELIRMFEEKNKQKDSV